MKKRRLTIKDVARHANTSVSTVSLVIRGSSLVKGSTREKVQIAIDEIGYVYNKNAAALRGPVSGFIGVIINNLLNPFFSELTVSLGEALEKKNLFPVLINTSESIERQERAIKSLYQHGISALLICPALGSDESNSSSLFKLDIPTIVMSRPLKNWKGYYLGADNMAGTEDAVRYLMNLGHKHIAFIGGKKANLSKIAKLRGYLNVLQERDLEINPEYQIETPPLLTGGDKAVETLLKMKYPPTAALCFNDSVAMGVISSLNRRGLQVPRDFSVVGFDDIQSGQFFSPRLSTVAVNIWEMGQLAADYLLSIQNNTQSVEKTKILPTELIIRDSCEAPPLKGQSIQ